MAKAVEIQILRKYLNVNKGRVEHRSRARGKKNFLKRILREANRYQLPTYQELNGSGWHTHGDWRAYGNIDWDFRLHYIIAKCVIFKKFAENLGAYREPYQLYIFLYRDFPQSDAIYFNIPDPKPNEYFPMKYENVEWGVPDLEELFSKLLGPHKIKVGVVQGQYPVIIIYSPDIGVPIE